MNFPNVYIENKDRWGPIKPFKQFLFLGMSIQLFKHVITDMDDQLNLKNNNVHNSRKDNIFISNWYSMQGKQKKNSIISVHVGVLAQQEFSVEFDYVTNNQPKRTEKNIGKKTFTRTRLERNGQKDQLKIKQGMNKTQTESNFSGNFKQNKKNRIDKKKKLQNKKKNHYNKNYYKLSPSIEIKPDWRLCCNWSLSDIEEYKMSTILNYINPIELKITDAIYNVRESLNDIQFNKPHKLRYTNNLKKKYYPIIEDPIFKKYENQGNIFITSEIMAILMGFLKSKISFDIMVKKKNEKLWFYLREESQLNQTMIYENITNSNDKDIEKKLKEMSIEANLMIKSFEDQLLTKKQKKKVTKNNSILQNQNKIFNTYVYNSWKFPDYTIIGRCSFSGLNDKKERVKIFTITQQNSKTLNQISWPKYFDQKFGTIKASDIKQNTFRYVRCAIESILAGCREIWTGWVCRESESNSDKHNIIKVQNISIKEFVEEICYISINDIWEILHSIITTLLKENNENGKYIIYRKNNEFCLSIYKMNQDEF